MGRRRFRLRVQSPAENEKDKEEDEDTEKDGDEEDGDGLDNEIDAMRRGCSWPNGMISDLKEKWDALMMRNGVNAISMEGEETKKTRLLFPYSVSSLYLVFLSLTH